MHARAGFQSYEVGRCRGQLKMTEFAVSDSHSQRTGGSLIAYYTL